MPSAKDLLDPVAGVWFIMLAVGAVCLAKRRPRWGYTMLSLAGALSLFQTLGLGANFLSWRVAQWSQHTVHTLASNHAGEADAVVQCGGVLSPSPLEFSGADYGDAIDRFICAVEVSRLLQKPLVLGGGFRLVGGRPVEASSERSWLASWGVTNTIVGDLGYCQTTKDEALSAAKFAAQRGWKRIILVTSAYHMRRALAAFRHTGLEVVPVACDFMVNPSPQSRWSLRIIPSVSSLALIKLWAIEEVGFLWYQFRGWI